MSNDLGDRAVSLNILPLKRRSCANPRGVHEVFSELLLSDDKVT